MDPVTHLLASYTLARARRARLASPEMAVFLVAGIAPDVDWLWHLREPLGALRAYGTATHSVVGASVVAAIVGCGVWAGARRRSSAPKLPVLVGAALISAGAHVLLDLCSTTGIELYWPWSRARISWNIVSGFDAVLLAILAACALLPALFGLVTEEIGGRKDPRPGRAWPVTAVALSLLFFWARGTLHGRAELLLARAEYKGKSAIHSAAFASGSSPITWRGVVETETFLAEVEVRIGVGGTFAPERANLQYKPEPSALVDAAAGAPLARAYTALARFPLLTLETTATGTRAELRELGDSILCGRRGCWHAVIDLDAQSRVAHEELWYAATRSP